MRAGVLTKSQIVPVPGRTTRIVARNLLDAHRRGLAEFGRQHDDRKFRAERKRQIDDAHRAGRDRAGKFHETISFHFASPVSSKSAYAPSSRSTALGLAARRWRMSSATSPTNTSSSPRLSADTIDDATTRGATFGGGTVWNHSISS